MCMVYGLHTGRNFCVSILFLINAIRVRMLGISSYIINKHIEIKITNTHTYVCAHIQQVLLKSDKLTTDIPIARRVCWCYSYYSS